MNNFIFSVETLRNIDVLSYDYLTDDIKCGALDSFVRTRSYPLFDKIIFSKYAFAQMFFEPGFTDKQRLDDDRACPVLRNIGQHNYLAMPIMLNDIIVKLNSRIR